MPASRSIRIRSLFLALIVSCALARSLPAADFAESNFAIAVWRTEQGLPQNFIKGVLQAHDGYLWVATFNGLARFDGVRFTVFDVGNTPELRNNLVNRIFEDSQGRLWVGHDNGDIELYAAGHFVRLEVPKEWPTQPIDNIAEDAAGGIWVLNRDGWLLRVDPSLKVERIFKTDPLGDFLVRDLAGRIWVRKAAPGGCLFQTIDSTAPLVTPPLENNARAFASRKGGLWIVEKDRVRRWDGGQWVEERRAFPTLDMFHPVLLETRDGSLVAGCFKSGLYILKPDDELQQVTTAAGLAHDWVYCLGEDREGNLWVGTGGGGLNMLHARRVKMLNAPDNWLGRAVLSVAPSDNGGLWIATEGAGIYHSRGTEVKPIPQNSDLPTSVFWSVLEKSNQSVWLGSWDEGLFLLSNGVARVTPKGRPIPPEVVCLYTDGQERLWVGTTAGLGCLEGGKWTEYAAGQDLPKPDVRCLTEAADGSIWFGTMGAGLCRIQGNQVTRFTKADGLVNDYVWALWAAPNGDLWIGTCGGGLSRFHDGKFTSLTTRQGLPSNVICHIDQDARGDLWMSSYGGIFRVTLNALNRCADGTERMVNCLVYDRADGLSTLEFSGGCQPSGCRMKDGRLCFATRAGVAIVDPAQTPLNLLPPPVLIEEFLVDGKVQSTPLHSDGTAGEVMELQPGERRIQIRFTALSFSAPERVRFRYQMEGLDKGWIDAEARRSVDYTYLPPGKYRFRVMACNSDGVWNDKDASLAFTVLPHFWQTWWFSASCWLAGFGLLAGSALVALRRRHRRRLEVLERQRALEHERARIAEDIHDELGASLTRIIMFSQSAQAKSKAGQSSLHEVNTIFTTAREVTRSMDEIVWAINPKHDTLGSLAAYLANYVSEFLEPTEASCDLNFSIVHPNRRISAEVRHDLFLAFKEALNNAVKHSAANKIAVSLQEGADQFVLSVHDDGQGFESQVIAGRASEAVGAWRGNGLQNMRKRLRANGGDCQIESHPNKGTQIQFTMPLSEDHED